MKGLAVVSGGTGGIGRAVVESLWTAGYSIIALGRNTEKIEVLRQWFWEHDREEQMWNVVSHDLGDRSTDHMLDMVLYKQIPTLLAVCHGAAPQPCKADEAEKTLRMVFEVDVIGTLMLCTAVGAKMLEAHSSGSVVIISSMHAKATYPERLPYATCKAAISGLIRSLALEYGQHGITVNAICPWQVEGERTNRVAEREYREGGIYATALYRERSPMRQLITPGDIAQTVLWLAECKSMNGAEIILDSGVSASMWHRPFEVKI